MESVFLSREIIKPSSPTPYNLRTYKLSLLDQVMVPVCYPMVFYFPMEPSLDNEASSSERIKLLKHSLSLNLTHFYPFSGTVKDSLSIDCNDEGVPFLVAKVKAKLSDFLKDPISSLQQNPLFLHAKSILTGPIPGANVCEIQVNQFDCGGIAVGVVVSRQVADTCTLMMFLKSWAAIARGSDEFVAKPIYVAQSLFPQMDGLQEDSCLFHNVSNDVNLAKYVTKRFIFDSSAIAILKAKLASPATPSLSRVEVVSAFLWKCFMAASDDGMKKPFLLTHTVNIRRRAKPSLPENCFGNLLWLAAAQCVYSSGTNLNDVLTKVREGINKVDDGLITSLQRDGYYECLEKTRKRLHKEAKYLSCTSWCNFGMYDLDFGWGKPFWVSSAIPSKSESRWINMLVLNDVNGGSGVEAWMHIEEKYAEALEKNEEIHSFASIDPSLPLEM